MQGITVEDRAYAGGWWDWLTPFSMLTGVALVAGYALLGATWLVLKTEGALQARMRHYGLHLAVVVLGLIALVSILTPFQDPVYLERWFTWPGVAYTGIVPIVTLILAFGLFRGLRNGAEMAPFLCALGLFVACFVGIGISFYPHMVPPSLTITEAAAPDESLAFALVGAMVLIPMILVYTAYSYWVFRGKVRPGDGYH